MRIGRLSRWYAGMVPSLMRRRGLDRQRHHFGCFFEAEVLTLDVFTALEDVRKAGNAATTPANPVPT